ncbi:MAG: DUF460 domain-containing protein [Candidatus Bathyarchaeia archaeon]
MQGIGKRKIIVGIDPGMTCGLAVISLEGKPILIESYRGISKLDLIALIADKGDPVIVATDVQAPPDFAENIARKFEAVIFTFPTQMPAAEKHKLVQEYALSQKLELEDSHQKDALAAALKAFNHFKNKFTQAEVHVQEKGIKIPLEEVKSLIVKGFTIAEAVGIIKVEEERGKVEAETVPHEALKVKVNSTFTLIANLKAKIQDQNMLIARLRRLNERRLQELHEAKLQAEALRRKLAAVEAGERLEIRREQEYRRLNSEILNLRRRIDELEEKLAKAKPLIPEDLEEMKRRGEVEILKVIPAFSQDKIEEVSKRVGINSGEVLLLEDASGGGSSTARLLIEKGVRAVIVGSNISHPAFEEFLKVNLPVINSKELQILWFGETPYVKSEDLCKAIENFKNVQRLERARMLEKLISQYRTEKII